MIITIDPLNSTTAEKKLLLYSLFRDNPDRLLWRKDVNYILSKETNIQFTHTVLLNKGSDDTTNYHVIAPEPLGEGGYGAVYEILSTLSLSEMTVTRNLVIKDPCVVKVVSKKKTESHSDFELRVEREYNASQIATHLMMKESPIFYRSEAFLIMKKQPGIGLFNFIHSVHNSNVSWQLLWGVTHALLDAFHQQVVMHKIAHRDIKPQNMMIDFGSGTAIPKDLTDCTPGRMPIYILDYGLSLPYGVAPLKRQGTLGYIAPEVSLHPLPTINDEKSDLFAIGIILKILWCFCYDQIDMQRKLHDDKQRRIYNQRIIKSSSPYFSFRIYSSILDVIWKMTRSEPTERFSLQDSLYALKNIACDLFTPTPIPLELSRLPLIPMHEVLSPVVPLVLFERTPDSNSVATEPNNSIPMPEENRSRSESGVFCCSFWKRPFEPRVPEDHLLHPRINP